MAGGVAGCEQRKMRMTRAEDVERFRALLSKATGAVGRDYFMLPVADGEGGEPLIQYRPRARYHGERAAVDHEAKAAAPRPLHHLPACTVWTPVRQLPNRLI